MGKSLDKSKLLFDNKYLIALIVPLVVEVFLSVAVGMIDTMMVAQAGEAAVSGVSVINNIQNLLVFLLLLAFTYFNQNCFKIATIIRVHAANQYCFIATKKEEKPLPSFRLALIL